MQRRRQDDDMKFGSRHDPCAVSRRDYVERSPRGRRSLSPRAVDKSRGYLGGGGGGGGRSNPVERKVYEWDLRGRRGEPVRSGSPLPAYGIEKRAYYNEGLSRRELPSEEMQRRYDFVDHVDKKIDVGTGLKPEYRYRQSDSTGALTGKELHGGRLPEASRHGMSEHELVVAEYPQGNSLRMSKDFGPTSKYGEAGGSYVTSDLDVRGYKDERAQYPDSLRGEKVPAIGTYRERENPVYARDISNHQLSVSNSKDYTNTSQYKDFGGTSSGTRVNMASYRDGIPPLADEYTRSSLDLKDSFGYSGFGQRFTSDSGRDPKTEHKDSTILRRDTNSPSRAERHDYTNRRVGIRDIDGYDYPSDEAYRRIDSRAPHFDYYDNEDLLRSGTKLAISERGDNADYAYSNVRDRSVVDHPSTRKQIASDYLGGSASTERFYSESSRAEYGTSSSRWREIPHLGVSRDHEFSASKAGYGFGRDAGPTSHDDRMIYSPDIRYEREMPRDSGRRTQFAEEDEFGTYGSADRGFKRKYNEDTDMNRHNSRSTKSGKWYNNTNRKEYNDSSEKWSGRDSSASFASRNMRHDEDPYGRAERTYVRGDRHRRSPSEDWPSSHDHMEHVHEHRPYKPGGRFSRGRLKPGPLSSRLSNNLNRRLSLPKPNNVWVRGRDDIKEDMPEYDNESEDWGNSGKSEPPEDTEDFKQLVQKAFLIFSKKLNENPSVRKRYTEQGKAGFLFCIVCGRSLSKEFMDTRRLVTHAFMSHKVGLRAQHLGLQKAICVLLGWNNDIPTDVITWVPEVLPDAEAMAQREDLIVWPPVVIIHDGSVAESKAEESGVTLEAVGDFLRSKGFSGGKFRVCRGGKPGDQSILVVKFLGTFSGLEDAERLHNYFSENKQGRDDFRQSTLSTIKGKSSNGGDSNSKQRLNLELALFGYLAIAEDLDKADFDTKKKCLIKSKKEIVDLANAPVKP